MDDNRLLKALAEGLISYAFYVLLTTPKSDLILAKAKMYRAVAHTSQKLAALVGSIGITAEKRANEIME